MVNNQKASYNRFLLLVAGLGGLLYGIDVGIIAGALPYLDATSGLKTVYVELRDAGGRTAISTASIQYDPKSTPRVTPIGPGAQVTSPPSQDATPTPFPTIFATVAPVQTVQPVVTVGFVATQGPVATVTPIILVVVPVSTHATSPQPTVQATAQSPSLIARQDAPISGWILPGYLIVQAIVIVIVIIGFFRMKTN